MFKLSAVRITYTFMPLTYHHGTWLVSKLVPYFVDQCYQTSECRFVDYMNFCFEKQEIMLASTGKSQNELISLWVNLTAESLNIDPQPLADVFTDADAHNSEMRTRTMWKYAVSRSVSGTPSVFVNGVLLENNPFTAQGWLDLVQELYD